MEQDSSVTFHLVSATHGAGSCTVTLSTSPSPSSAVWEKVVSRLQPLHLATSDTLEDAFHQAARQDAEKCLAEARAEIEALRGHMCVLQQRVSLLEPKAREYERICGQLVELLGRR